MPRIGEIRTAKEIGRKVYRGNGDKTMEHRFKRIDFKTGRELKPGERASRVNLHIPAIYKGTAPYIAPRPAALISDRVSPFHFFLPKIKGG